jgi:hypothetical protein
VVVESEAEAFAGSFAIAHAMVPHKQMPARRRSGNMITRA